MATIADKRKARFTPVSASTSVRDQERVFRLAGNSGVGLSIADIRRIYPLVTYPATSLLSTTDVEYAAT